MFACVDEEVLNRIEEEYRIWKKNAPFLYDTVVTHCLEWPSLTVEWMPEKMVIGSTVLSAQSATDLVAHKLLLGTYTSDGDQNYLMQATGKKNITSFLCVAKGGCFKDPNFLYI